VAGRIEDYAIIGDMQTAALVCSDGSIDWLCLPRFDAGACFAALLGSEQNGFWRIAPSSPGVSGVSAREPARDSGGDSGRSRSLRSYRGDTLVLETRWETADGSVRVIDFMPPSGEPSVVRIVEGVHGAVEMPDLGGGRPGLDLAGLTGAADRA
jgi:GH15 family glucan-1,4-alpha-glucosidase